MFEYKIDNAHAAYELMKEGWPTKIVSLIGPDINFDLPWQGDHHLIKVFHDFEGPVDPRMLEESVWDLQGHDLILPKIGDLYEVLDFCSGLGDEDRLLIHCHAGRSRSAAMLIGILFDHMGAASLEDARDAVAMVKEVRPTMIPNRLMIKYLDEIFADIDLPGNFLSQAVKEYWDNCTLPGIMLRTQLSGWKD